MTIYIIDNLGILTGPVELPVIPGLGVQMPSNAIELAEPLPAPAAGHVWALVEGDPTQLADHRGTVYSTATGVAQQHDQLGALPDGLTALRPMTDFDVWTGAAWATDEAAKESAEAAEIRAAIADRRWQAEVAGIDIGGTHIDTDDRSKTLIAGSALKAMRNAEYTLNWKTPEGFVQIPADQVLSMADAVSDHVQACFDRESELLDALEAGTFTPEMLEEGWTNEQVPESTG